MTNKKSMKRALITSVTAMTLSASMLVGTTFAWFTDTATSSGNKIQAGTLDVELLMWDGDSYEDISENSAPIFGSGSIAQDNNLETLWEPGKTQVAYLAIQNNGSLDLKYDVALDVTSSTNDLYKVMEYFITPGARIDEGVTAATWEKGEGVQLGKQTVSSGVSLGNGDTHYFALSVHMSELADDTYQNGDVAFDLNVLAAQVSSESDSYGKDYDALAPIETEVTELKALLAEAKSGDTVEFTLTENALVTEGIKVPEGVNLVLNGNGNTIWMDLPGTGFYAYRAGLTIKDVNITGSAQCAIFTKGDRGIVDGKMVEYLVYPVLENVTVDMDQSSLAPLYFNGMGEATLTNCTLTGDGQDSTYYSNGAHVFAGAEMKVVIDGGNVGNVFINANGESPESIFASGVTVKSGVVEKLILESDWRTDKAGNATYTYEGGTVKEVVKVADTGAELESILKEVGYSVAVSGDVTLEGHLTSSNMGDITIYGRGDTLSIRGIYGNNGANVTLNNLTLVDNNPTDYTIYNQGGKIELTNVTYNGNNNKAFQLAGGGDVILTDCNITGEVTGTYSASNIWCGDGRNVTINGGTYGSIFMNVSEGANVLSASKITVNDGTIGKLILETEKNTRTGDGTGYKSAVLVQNGGTITELVENPQNYNLTGLTKLN